ncbi:hypothetical protein PTTG_26897 [Puccinia triticina 1-1 BBBD Race 1]|uniref:Uncharacterized protein n=1 Tax=Puccinia triticina (isolate 1-1 / race 1 (BBBD)) TaxID=630390 RepID=A0A180GRR8_PUCT1|nr:hypothetical protein PTTG_26897 [Puccinia triticina 1-1 BBBD Race 1]
MNLPRLVFLLLTTLLAAISALPQKQCGTCKTYWDAERTGRLLQCTAPLLCPAGGRPHGTCPNRYHEEAVYTCRNCDKIIHQSFQVRCGPPATHWANCRCPARPSPGKTRVHPL